MFLFFELFCLFCFFIYNWILRGVNFLPLVCDFVVFTQFYQYTLVQLGERDGFHSMLNLREEVKLALCISFYLLFFSRIQGY